MRISDWSSDVCSSDLRPADRAGSGAPHRPVDRGRAATPRVGARGVAMSARSNVAAMTDALVHLERRADGVAVVRLDNGRTEERRVGKRGSVRLDLGGCRIIQKKNTINIYVHAIKRS